MDGQRFDELTKSLARGTSRRRMLKGLAGGAMAVLLGRGVRDVAAGGTFTCGAGVGACPSGLICCSGSCKNLRTDPNNCGRCGRVCSTNLCNAGRCVASCPSGFLISSGTCVRTCPMGETACDGQCRDLTTDVNNCGGCGTVCASQNSSEICCEGICCAPGLLCGTAGFCISPKG